MHFYNSILNLKKEEQKEQIARDVKKLFIVNLFQLFILNNVISL